MSQTNKVHKLQVRNRPEADGKISVGARMEVLLDGQPLRGVTFFKFEVSAKKVAKVQFEMLAEVDIEVAAILPHKELKKTGYTKIEKGDTKAVALYEISSYSPRTIAVPEAPAETGCAVAGSTPYCSTCACGKKEAFEKKSTRDAVESAIDLAKTSKSYYFEENVALSKCAHCDNPVEAARYSMCYNCWWARDPRSNKGDQNDRNE